MQIKIKSHLFVFVCIYLCFKDAFCPVPYEGFFGPCHIPALTYIIGLTIMRNIFIPIKGRTYSKNIFFNVIHDMRCILGLKNYLPWNWNPDLFRRPSAEDIKLGQDISKKIKDTNKYGKNFFGHIGREFRKQYETARELEDLFNNKNYNLTEVG
jgi:hypothetical protein